MRADRKQVRAAFWLGYKAFVDGGRVCKYVGPGHTVRDHTYEVVDSSLEPFDCLSDIDKRDWREGVEYARAERDECRKIEK